MSAEIKSCKDAHKCGRYNRCSLQRGPSLSSPPTLFEMKRLTRMLFSPDLSAMGTNGRMVGRKNNFGK